MASNDSKPYQSQLIRSAGFSVPETLVTTDPDAARAFWRRHGDVIYKSVSSIRSIVTRLTLEHIERMRDVRWCPTQLQAYVHGQDYRVHVVGQRLFATAITSSADDYRYASRQGAEVALRTVSLPDDVAERCLALSKVLELPLAGVDLRRADNGDWYCFEVNPSPCFTYYEHHTHQPMAEAVAHYLAS
jgi:glutathione synthase/RimK-type ligase-like ATP-grasp enzyme